MDTRSAHRLLAIVAFGLLVASVTVAATATGTPTPAGTPLAQCPPGTPTPGGATPPGPTPTDPADYDFEVVGGVIEIRMTERGFDPQAFQIAVGHHIEVTLVNLDTRPHTFTMESLDVDVTVEPGQTERITISAPRYGDYIYVSTAPCDVGPEWRGLMRIFL